MQDDFGYEGRRRRRFPVLERLRTLPLIGAAVFTVALLLLVYQMLQTPMMWSNAEPADSPVPAVGAPSPRNPDVPPPNSPPPAAPASPGATGTPAPGASPSAISMAPSSSASPSPAPPAPPAPPAAPRTTRYEAESASMSGARSASDHPGFSGVGFVDYDNTWGSWVQWDVTAPKSGPATVVLRFANGSGRSRTMSISVNGVPVLVDLLFDDTRGWENWQSRTVSIQLNAGTNTIRATAVNPNGGPNVDFLELTA
ncbi:CBM35 domain-containing protein [Catellatospora tritici]|uniref:CBM35 domain-containing protein n=1 Tax=Catellatospora tritici TaxID=2851566 RepID=UPI001C2DB732|nr:CBM35 domain-containing protein [Catellatospora tritici]MBV1856061.1 carbohydrate-binding protein [Catellatospora tritici]